MSHPDASGDIKAICERIVLEFNFALDMAQYAEMERFFDDDGVWNRQEGNIVGVEDLREKMALRPAGRYVRHVITNMRTTVVSANSAVVESYVTVYRHDFPTTPIVPAVLTGPDVVGRYRDQLRNDRATWKIARREVFIDFKKKAEG